ncbi:MAG: nitroreductase family deazaflavin-dependent oxidoreductase [Actinobacteria bacterium]|nr:nitroreductase family deazaflavin-dependent oxidoreductase [Actinomycetota bacterium]
MTLIPPRAVERAMARVHGHVYRASSGRLGSSFGGAPILLLTTTGRMTGQPRTTPVMYLEHEGSFVVMASNGGRDEHPQWYLNIKAGPDATVTVGQRERRVTASEAAAEMAERMRPRFAAMWKGYETYAARTVRSFPVVLLQPVD